MKISDMLMMCVRNLWRRKGRTFLTVIGVIIGCCAIIVMISLGLGMNAAMDNMLSSWGDLTAVTIYNNNGGGGMIYMDSSSSQSGDTEKIPLDDAAIEMLKGIENVASVIPQISVDSNMLTVVAGRKDRYRMSWVQVVGIDFSKLSEMGYAAESGELPTVNDNDTVIFGNEVAYNFMDTKKKGQSAYTWKQQLPDGTFTQPKVDPLTNTLTFAINNTSKMEDDGSYRYGGRGYEYEMECPAILETDVNWETPYSVYITTERAIEIINAYNKLNKVKDAKAPEYSQVKIKVDTMDHVDAVQKAVEEMGFSASSMASMRNEMQGQLGVIQLVLGCLAAISLLVAAIGITNTMIMSIYERTREIGIMKVLGCFISNIRVIFLIEAGMIGLLGGGIGILISYIISTVMNSLGGTTFSSMLGIYSDGSSPVSIIPFWLVLLALAFSTLIGLISGFYPANRAVKISALEAIKNE